VAIWARIASFVMSLVLECHWSKTVGQKH